MPKVRMMSSPPTHLVLVFAGDVGLAEGHEVVDVVAGIEKEASDGRVGDFVFGQDDGAEVEEDQFLDIFHVAVEGQA